MELNNGQSKKEHQKVIFNSEELIEWGGLLNEFLWVCAGVNRKVLRQCPTDYAKYAGIGGTILFTALMAMLSGGYALYTVFDSLKAGAVFGVFWGLLIFNLDRFIVNTMYSDGEVTISKKELFAGMPRIIMAIFLGIVISTPLELRIFKDEISVVIEEQKQERIRQYKSFDEAKIAMLNSKKDSLENVKNDILSKPDAMGVNQDLIQSENSKIRDLQKLHSRKVSDYHNEDKEVKKYSKWRQQWTSELNELRKNNPIDQANENRILRNISTNQKSLQAHIAARNALQKEISEIEKQLNDLGFKKEEYIKEDTEAKKKAIADINTEIDKFMCERDSISKVVNTDTTYSNLLKKEYGGFQAQMSAFNKMKEDNSSTAWSSLFITLLFIIVETAPTFFKMMIASGPYDDLLRAEMHRVRVLSDKRISDINDTINTEVQISVEKNKKRLETELAENDKLMGELAKVQSELLQIAIDEWRKVELEKIKKDPSQYIKMSESEKVEESQS